MTRSYRRVKLACYTANLSMAAVCNLSPLLFLTFRSLYGLSYTLLGFLVLVNFVTQLTVDMIFSFFSHKFNMRKAVKLTPVLTATGLLLYALAPLLFPNAVYAGLLLGTIIFSASGGFVEVLLSPLIAAIPADDPDREMSKLHSVYAWGVVGVVLISTLFLIVFGGENWQWLALTFMLIPLCSAVLFIGAEIPHMPTPERVSGVLALMKTRRLWSVVLTMFLAGAAECTMAQWASGYLEQALGLSKLLGDVCGVAFFALMMALGRSLYAKQGRGLSRVLLLCAIGATVCYLVAALSPLPMIGLLACALCGLCVSMLWPGSVIVGAERIPTGGVFLYAMMAAGGDLGASVGPQMIGAITDAAISSPRLSALAVRFGLLPEQLGMKLGMLVATLFPLAAVFFFLYLRRERKPQ